VSTVLVSEHTPRLDSGHGLRHYAVARALASTGVVDVVYAVFGASEPATEFLDPERFRLHPVRSSRGFRRAALYARARLAGVPPGFARGISPDLLDAVDGLAASGRARIVADGPVTAAALLVQGRHHFVYNAHNFESELRARIGDTGMGSTRTLRRFEARLLARAEESWMVSERDMGMAAELCPAARLRLVPNAVDVAAIEPFAPDLAARRAVFVGSLDYEPNRRALRLLLEDVMPRVWEELPDARLRVVGRGAADRSEPDPRVELLGFVESIRDAYDGATCVVVPLLEGGGSPLKFIEALAYGLPVVATDAAAAGLAVEPGRHFRRANGAEELAAALLAALRGEASSLGGEGRAFVHARYSVEAVARALEP
jgi:polysaccharide biosynthesis protein PslH